MNYGIWEIFRTDIKSQIGIKCKSFWLCGASGYFIGLVSLLPGRRGIMACTRAVESVVVNHLHKQIIYLKNRDDTDTLKAVESILKDEQNHRDTDFEAGGTGNIWYQPSRFAISTFTEAVIRFEMR